MDINEKFINFCKTKKLDKIKEFYNKNQTQITYKTLKSLNELSFKEFIKSKNVSDLKLWLVDITKTYFENHKNEELNKELVEACKSNNFNKVKEIFENDFDKIRNYKDAFEESCKNFNQEIVNYIVENSENQKVYYKWNSIPKDSKNNMLIYSIEKNNLQFCKFLKSIGANINFDSEKPFITACNNKNIEIMNWLNSYKNINFSINNNSIYISNLMKKNIEVLDWFHNNTAICESYCSTDIFLYCCDNGNINMAKDLIKNNPTYDFSNYYENVFKKSIDLHNLEFAQWIYSLDEFEIDIIHDGILKCCKKGQAIIENNNEDWFLNNDMVNLFNNHIIPNEQQNNNPENVQQNNINLFDSIEQKYFEIFKWLISLEGVELEQNDNEFFNTACKANNILVAQWFKNHNNRKYMVEINNGKINGKIMNNYDLLKEEIKENKITNYCDEEIECPICIDKKKYNVKLDCKHIYCTDCFDNIQHKKCSSCLKKIDINTIQIIMNKDEFLNKFDQENKVDSEIMVSRNNDSDSETTTLLIKDNVDNNKVIKKEIEEIMKESQEKINNLMKDLKNKETIEGYMDIAVGEFINLLNDS